ncbi:MAG TPA: type II toxin-antitoxin system RelE/ParE family toxin [Pantanalinema sp.]
MSSWTYVFSGVADKQFGPLKKQDQLRIIRALDRLVFELNAPDQPRQSDLKKLSGKANQWRLRAGVYRVRFEQDGHQLLVTVLKVAHRREAYRD